MHRTPSGFEARDGGCRRLISAWLGGLLVASTAVGGAWAASLGDLAPGQRDAQARQVDAEGLETMAGSGESLFDAGAAAPPTWQPSSQEHRTVYRPPRDPNAAPGAPPPSERAPPTWEPVPASDGAPFDPGDRPARPTVVAVMVADASRELERSEMAHLRGGFFLAPKVGMRMVMEFRAQVNGAGEHSIPIPTGFTGVLTGVRDGVPFAQGTNQFSGLISLVQNNLDFQQINALTTVRFDLFGSLSAVRSSLMRSQLNFNAVLQTR